MSASPLASSEPAVASSCCRPSTSRDGQAVQLVQGVAGLGEALRRPARGGAELAAPRRRVDPPRRPRRRLRPRPQPRPARRDRRHPRHQGGDERRHPRRRVARRGDGRPAAAASTSAPRRSSSRPGAPRPSRRTATGSPSGSTYAAGRWRPAAGPRTAATCTTCWPGSTARAAPATSSPTSTRTACCRARTSTCCASVCAATDRPVVASGGITELSDLAALTELVPDGVEGAIVGTALYEGRFTLEDALALTGRRREPRGAGDPLPRRGRRPGGEGGQLPASCATRATPSSSPRCTTRRAPTSSPSSTSRPRTRAGPPPWTSCRGPPSRCSSR